MRNLTYSMGVSLDGFIAGPDGEIDWSTPDERLHRFHNEQLASTDLHLCGRRLYEEMLPWERVDETSPSPRSPNSHGSGRRFRRSSTRGR